MKNRIARTGVFLAAGALGIARGAIGFRHPAYWAPVTTGDWIAVSSFSAFLLSLAAAFVLLARTQRRPGRWVFGCAASGAAIAGIANALEDGIGVRALGYPFAAGVTLMMAALLLGGLWLITCQPRQPWVGVLCCGDVLALPLGFDTTGLMVFASTAMLLGFARGVDGTATRSRREAGPPVEGRRGKHRPGLGVCDFRNQIGLYVRCVRDVAPERGARLSRGKIMEKQGGGGGRTATS